ncbi:MAG: Lrp/AsnC family transcriptional regulator [Spirochaetales bacterium]|jgi:DNA-binding Lrp family transcriptional regulator|nr:Lrp/AsnC family transcriptional regulator [Spirochaetales bacterium]
MEDKKYSVDELDMKIIAELQDDGRMSFRTVAEKLEVSDQTVRLRVTRMMEHGFLRVSPLINPFAFDNSLLALIGMQLEKRTQKETMETIASMRGVVSVYNTAGEFDLFVEVFHRSRSDLNKFLFEELPKVPGIKSTHSYISLDARHKWIEVGNCDI